MSGQNSKNSATLTQPRFGVLRPLGDFKGEITNTNVNYEDLWKHDQYIHNDQFRTNVPEDDPAYGIVQLYASVKSKSGHVCHFCGFEDEEYLEVHHLDGNHFNNTTSNLVAACTLCHRQHHLLWLSLCDHAELGAADMDYLPQTELNHLQRIAMVMAHSPEHESLLGTFGKLGTMIKELSNNFSRPLHSFMVSDEEKLKFRQEYMGRNKIASPINDFSAKFSDIQTAMEAMNTKKPSASQEAALLVLDNFIGAAEAKRTDPNMTNEEYRGKQLTLLNDCVAKYEKDLEREFERIFNEDPKVFSIFELAVALKTVDYASYKAFNPQKMYLIFKPGIFSKEQIEYYRSLPYFDVSKWNMGTQ